VPPEGMSEIVKQFIFEHIDSVEQLDVLLLLHSTPSQEWTVDDVTKSLKTNPSSVANRLARLKDQDFLEQTNAGNPATYRYKPKSPEIASVIDMVAQAYTVRRHTIYELIFSPMKKARSFADAFIVRGPPKSEDEGNG
jgi:hypothetical protein